jgi:RNA polymerase sigma-70 factor (ECF subfamily)
MVSNFDVQWLERARRGDDEAFSQIVESCQNPVYNLCYRMLGNPQEAEDAAQETFWRAYQNIKRYDPQRPFLTWLLSIAAHYCIDQQRRRQLPSFSIDALTDDILPDFAPTPENTTGRREEERKLHQLLTALKPQDRAAIILRYWYDFSDEEISQALSLTVSAVKSRLHRARLQLAEDWQANEPDDYRSEREKYGTPTF